MHFHSFSIIHHLTMFVLFLLIPIFSDIKWENTLSSLRPFNHPIPLLSTNAKEVMKSTFIPLFCFPFKLQLRPFSRLIPFHPRILQANRPSTIQPNSLYKKGHLPSLNWIRYNNWILTCFLYRIFIIQIYTI